MGKSQWVNFRMPKLESNVIAHIPLYRYEILTEILLKIKLFHQNQQPLKGVEPFERILRAMPYKFSKSPFLDRRNASNRF